VRSLARRYSYRGEQFEDLVQIGAIGLIKAIDRFDLERGVELTTYATPNIIGEIKRHFRDRGWAVRVPRGLQELNVQLSKLVEGLTVQYGRSPTIPELAKAAGVDEEDVLEALESGRAYSSLSLSQGSGSEDGEDLDPLESLGEVEHQYEVSEDRAVLAPGFKVLDERERRILHLRFFEGLTQSQIARQVGISQMHVSRLIRRSLEKIREEIDVDELADPVHDLRLAALQMADEVVNIDLTADELITRMKEGKIYDQSKIEIALRNFFQPDTILQLRELALKEVATQVERKIDAEVPQHTKLKPERFLACISSNAENAAKIIRKTSRLAQYYNSKWFVLYVQTPWEDPDKINLAKQRHLINNFKLAAELGAEVIRLKDNKITAGIMAAAEQHHHRMCVGIDQPGHHHAALGRKIDTVAVLEFFPDISPRFASPFGRCANPPKSVANRLHAVPRQLLYTHSGGNMPQYLVNRFAEEIANGETELALICGAELLRSTQNARKAGLKIDWNEDPGGEPTRIGDKRVGFSDEEARHELRAAIHFYPLLENAIRGGLKRDVGSHMMAMGRLFERLAAVAKDNPLATRREGYSAERLATTSNDNRWICFPYPRLMNSNAIIDQAAAILVTSVGKAREWGIPQERWVFLHGCADGTDTWVVSERERLDTSPAIKGCARLALEMAGKKVADVAAFDLYSCFPSAVEVAMKEIGIADDDPRPISVTGGLPFFGGPGNNYVTHSIAEMMSVVRRKPGSFGMVTANGNYLTKHSAGLYSTEPVQGPWRREDPKKFQAELDARPKQRMNTKPGGIGTIETYCVAYGKDAPERAYIFGRLDSSGERFVAMTGNDPALLADMLTTEQLGRRVFVREQGGRNIFRPWQ